MNKKYTKKLTNAGTASCIFAVLAFVFGLCGSVFEPVSTMIHNNVFKNDIDNMFLYDQGDTVKNIYSFFVIYGQSVFMAVLSFVVIILLFKNKSKKALSSASASLIIFSVLAAVPLSVFGMVYEMQNDILKLRSNDTDQTVFISVCRLLVFCFPIVAGFFLLLAGLFLALKLSGESFAVEIEKVSKAAPEAFGDFPVENQFAASSFMPEKTPVQPDIPTVFPASVSENTENTVEATAPVNCPHCGAALKKAAKFCSSCGQKV